MILFVLTLGLSGCATEGKVPAEQAVASFYAAVRAHDGERACALLAPEAADGLRTGGQDCAKAILDLDLPGGQVRESAVWGDEAQVRLTHDTVFLHRFPRGWLVRAAGCTPRGDLPYRCEVKT
ncbi:hypothetical protein [Streptosporangium saharense]|uniref:Uncharacterized protein YceK n=1 Tax=Streptosporangium saharense TaxID=1706840 RepID=A0A7W7VP31_9ACTN|nr:hypothetical protein [Streptosporangium saharense]MBB4917248.1 uncharacterized protein YceK [Streptosporangium saharense]